MTPWYPLHESIRLGGVQTDEQKSKRIDPEVAARQAMTALAILERLQDQPGVVLADEVGMGKTFVALAVAASITLGDSERRPVAVMVPSSLSKKWPRDFNYFKQRCVAPDFARASAHSGKDG